MGGARSGFRVSTDTHGNGRSQRQCRARADGNGRQCRLDIDGNMVGTCLLNSRSSFDDVLFFDPVTKEQAEQEIIRLEKNETIKDNANYATLWNIFFVYSLTATPSSTNK